VPASMRKLPAAQAPAPTLVVNQLPQARAGEFTRTTAPDNQLPPTCARKKNDDVVKPLAPERYKVQLAISRETRQMLREAQDLLRHQIPDGDLATIFERALTLLLTELRRTRYGAVNRPRVTSACGTSRHVPASVKRAVWERDQGQWHLSAQSDVARSAASSNTITACLMPTVAQQVPQISSCAAVLTTRLRQSCGSDGARRRIGYVRLGPASRRLTSGGYRRRITTSCAVSPRATASRRSGPMLKVKIVQMWG
jgi:hypothetical protein